MTDILADAERVLTTGEAIITGVAPFISYSVIDPQTASITISRTNSSNDEFYLSSNGYKFYFALLPAIQDGSNSSIPDGKAGFVVHPQTNLKSFNLPGMKPVFQVLGRSPTTVEFSGIMTGIESTTNAVPFYNSTLENSITAQVNENNINSISLVSKLELFEQKIISPGKPVKLYIFSQGRTSPGGISDLPLRLEINLLLQSARFTVVANDRAYYTFEAVSLDYYTPPRVEVVYGPPLPTPANTTPRPAGPPAPPSPPTLGEPSTRNTNVGEGNTRLRESEVEANIFAHPSGQGYSLAPGTIRFSGDTITVNGKTVSIPKTGERVLDVYGTDIKLRVSKDKITSISGVASFEYDRNGDVRYTGKNSHGKSQTWLNNFTYRGLEYKADKKSLVQYKNGVAEPPPGYNDEVE